MSMMRLYIVVLQYVVGVEECDNNNGMGRCFYRTGTGRFFNLSMAIMDASNATTG